MPAALGLLVFLAVAQPSATDALKARDAEVRAQLPPAGAPMTPELRAKLQNTLTKAVDIEGMAKAALGKYWNEQPPAKRQKFTRVFLGRFKRVSGDQLDSYRSSKTEFQPEERLDGTVRVPTQLVVKGEPTKVIYVMRRQAKDWRIIDIIVDDVSTVENYRSSFAKIINKEGFDGLINRLSKSG